MDLTSPLLLTSALVLGLRHGIDWDHIAAITDIVTAAINNNEPKSADDLKPQIQALFLTTCYAVGHSAIVIILGLMAICFRAVLPRWLDGVMERIVGLTLLSLGIWVFYSLRLYLQGKQDRRLKSRWMLLWSALQNIYKNFQSALCGQTGKTALRMEKYGAPGAFSIGVIHGIGAETGTQVLLIAAVGTTSQSVGIAMLLSFATGLLLSNLAIAFLGIRGFHSTYAAKPLLITASILAGAFGITVGSIYISGMASALPDLQKLLGV
jgi:hypothetical protein